MEQFSLKSGIAQVRVSIDTLPPAPKKPSALGSYTPNRQKADGTWGNEATSVPAALGAPAAVLGMYQDMVNYPSFPRGWADQVAAAGATPHISLELDDYKAGHLQPAYNNLSFTRGDHDAWLVNWASQAAAWGKPFILRPFWECSFRDYPWAAGNTDVGNSPGSFIDAWRHNAAIFRKGVPQARLAWNVEVDLPGMIPLEDVYPGGAWVDILSVDGYNTGPGAWTKGDRPFADIFGPTCARLAHLAASKPIIISEIGVNRLLPTAANWFAGIPPALEQDTRFRAVAGVVFFNNTAWDGGTPLDFRYDQPDVLPAFLQMAQARVLKGTFP